MNEVKPEEIKPKIKKSKSMNLPEIKIEKDIDEYIKKFNKEEELAKFDKLYNQIKDKEKKKSKIKIEKIKQEEIKPKINHKEEKRKDLLNTWFNTKSPIVEEFDSLTIPNIIYQYDDKLSRNLYDFISKKVKEEKPVYDYLITNFFNEYNDKILNRISVDEYFKSLKYIINNNSQYVDYKDTYFDRTYRMPKSKGFNVKNQEKILYEKLKKHTDNLTDLDKQFIKNYEK
jgi:hypothetical protein